MDSAVRFRRLFDEATLIHQATGWVLMLNDTAVAFLEACDGRGAVDRNIARRVQDFDAAFGEPGADLAPFIRKLAGAGTGVVVTTGEVSRP